MSILGKLGLWLIQKAYRRTFSEAGALNALYGPLAFVDDYVFITKQDQVGCVWKLRGIDYECLDSDTVRDYTGLIDSALRDFDEDYRVYQYVIKSRTNELKGDESRRNTRDRLEHLRAKGMYTIDLYFVVMQERRSHGKLSKRVLRKNAVELEKRSAELLGKARGAFRDISHLVGSELLEAADAFRFLDTLTTLNPEYSAARSLQFSDHLDSQMADAYLATTADGLRIADKDVRVLSLVSPPAKVWPGLMQEFLRLDSSFILCTEYKRMDGASAIGKVNTYTQHFYYSQYIKNIRSVISMAFSRGSKADIVPDAAAKANVRELGNTMKRIANRGESLGDFSMTMVIYGNVHNASVASKLIASKQGKFVIETDNAISAYLSIIPGGHGFNITRIPLLSLDYSDLCLFWAPATGDAVNKHLANIYGVPCSEYLVALETNDKTPYYFNAHEADLLGCLIFGIMGSGKSLLTNMLLDHAQKQEGYTFVFDIGGSYRWTCAKHGGRYVSMELGGNDFNFNPFDCAKTANNIQFLAAFVRILISDGKYEPSIEDQGAIFHAVKTAGRLRDLQLPEHIEKRLYLWIGDGQYASVFDNPKDTLQFAKFQAFDFQGLDLHPQVAEAVLIYLFHRMSRIVTDKAIRALPKQLWADEVWKFLLNPTAQREIMMAGKTWRKHNGGIGMVTQSANDFGRAGMMDVINEICPTKILLANPGADIKFYREIFKLNEVEADLFAHLTGKGKIMVKTPTACRVLKVSPDHRALLEYSNDPATNILRDRYIEQYDGNIDAALDAMVSDSKGR